MKKKNLLLIISLFVVATFVFALYEFEQMAYAKSDVNLKQNTVTDVIDEQDNSVLDTNEEVHNDSIASEQDVSESSSATLSVDLAQTAVEESEKNAARDYSLNNHALKATKLTKGDDVSGFADTKKTVSEQKPDGSYDIRVSITGSIGTETHPAEVDVIYVVDKSGSMLDRFKFNQTRWDASLYAIKLLNNNLFNDNRIDPRFTIVGFSGDYYYDFWNRPYDIAWDDASVLTNWTNKNSIPENVKVVGGTNYQACLMVAEKQLKEARPNSKKVIIFLSDGNPTYYYDTRGLTSGYGGSYDESAMYYAQQELRNITSIDAFYTIGVGNPKIGRAHV